MSKEKRKEARPIFQKYLQSQVKRIRLILRLTSALRYRLTVKQRLQCIGGFLGLLKAFDKVPHS